MSTAPNVTVIPAKVQTAENRDKYHQLRVAAYCRVSTAQEEQQNSYQVAKVNTISVKGKQKRMGRSVGYRPDWKKAIVTLEGDKTIEFFEGLF